MNFLLSNRRYISEINYGKDPSLQERLVFDATIGSPYELIAASKGSLQMGSVVFHRMHRGQEPNAQLAYLEPRGGDESNDAGTFHLDAPVDKELSDRWISSGITNEFASLTVGFGFMPPDGLKYGAGPDGWQIQTWLVESHRHLIVEEITLIACPMNPRNQASRTS
jgi:hypothetical protein